MSLQDTYPCDCGKRVDLNNNYCPNCGDEVEIDWPMEFTASAEGMQNTAELINSQNLPHSDEILDALYYYPGEVRIHYEMSEDMVVSPREIMYAGKTWTPEEEDE